MTGQTLAKHAGLLVPFEMFRISQLAAIFSELLVSKARNILDAELVLTRHPSVPILLLQIEGSVIDGDPPEFWRENADLVSLASRAFPRQVIMYYVEPPPQRREGFMVAQQGQVLAADDATHDRMPPGATEADWPVARLCQQLRIPVTDLEGRFPGGPSVRAKMVEPAQIDDQALLTTLAGRDAGGSEAAAAPASAGQPATATAPAKKAGSLEEDTKRRERERQAEEAEQALRNEQVRSGLRYTIDDLGLVAAPQAELAEPEILVAFVVPKVVGDLPDGLPRELADQLQGKRIDVAVKVDFLSEVFVENTPLSRPMFEERATEATVGGRSVRLMEVLGPRLGYGTLISTGKAPHVFVSRKLGSALPEQLVVELLGGT